MGYMRSSLLVLGAMSAIALGACCEMDHHEHEGMAQHASMWSGVNEAVAVIYPTKGNTCSGVVRFINNPANLTDMGIAVTEVLREHGGQKVCIMYDSVSTMLIYLSSANISKFIHFVTNKLRLMDVSGIFLAVEKGLDPMLMTQLTTFVDTVIDTG